MHNSFRGFIKISVYLQFMNVKNLVLGVGIFIVFLLMLNYGIEAFYKSPQYEDFCKSGVGMSYPAKFDGSIASVNCTFNKQLQNQSDICYTNRGNPIYEYDDNGCTILIKECNYCQKDFEEADKAYNKVFFVIALIVGIIVLFAGYGLLSTEPVGSALMASGVGAIFMGSMRNWQNLSDVWRFLLLVVALILLVWIALRINRNVKGKESKKKRK